MSENEKILEIVNDFADGLEALAVKLKRDTVDLATRETEILALDKLVWEKKQGSKGTFEQTTEKANQNSDAWKALVAKLKAHQGFWQDSSLKYWFHMNDESVVDRREV